MQLRRCAKRTISFAILFVGVMFTAASAAEIAGAESLPPSTSPPILLEDVTVPAQTGENVEGSEPQAGSVLYAATLVDNVSRLYENPKGEGQSVTRKDWFPNPNRTRLYFGPTGRTLRKGEGYFSDTYLFLLGFAYGITDNVTIGGGGSIFPGLDPDEQFYYFNPKVGLKMIEQFDAAVSAFIFRIPDFDDEDDQEAILVGLLFFTGTIGTDDRSFTFGLGYGFADDEMADRPAIELGGEYRLGKRVSFVTENWIFPGVDDPMISYGIRFMGEKMAIDLGFVNVASEDAIYPGIPWVDFVFNF